MIAQIAKIADITEISFIAEIAKVNEVARIAILWTQNAVLTTLPKNFEQKPKIFRSMSEDDKKL